jgi:hypothetical protein
MATILATLLAAAPVMFMFGYHAAQKAEAQLAKEGKVTVYDGVAYRYVPLPKESAPIPPANAGKKEEKK